MTLDEIRAAATLPEGSFRSWDTMAVELEVAELLYALVRQLKPAVVVEAGSGNGYASRFIAEALDANGSGHLWTYEQDPLYASAARTMLEGLPATVVQEWSTVHADPQPDLVFIDSLGGDSGRNDDIYYWLTLHAGEGFVVVVHDANGIPELPGAGVRLSSGRGVWIGNA